MGTRHSISTCIGRWETRRRCGLHHESCIPKWHCGIWRKVMFHILKKNCYTRKYYITSITFARIHFSRPLTVKCPMDLRKYPFDVQVCNLKIITGEFSFTISRVLSITDICQQQPNWVTVTEKVIYVIQTWKIKLRQKRKSKTLGLKLPTHFGSGWII